LFEYDKLDSEPNVRNVDQINPYLLNARSVIIGNRASPICNVPRLVEGITPLDNGILSFTEDRYIEFLNLEPQSKDWFKNWITGDSFINSKRMYCLWLSDITPSELRQLPHVYSLVEQVRQFRLASKSSKAFALRPWQFRETTISNNYIIIPKTSSENRVYVPIGFVSDGSIVSSSCLMLPNGNLYQFGVLVSKMHMSWLSTIGGRLENRYRYSAKLVYNNFPFPLQPTALQRRTVEQAAQQVLDARAEFPNSSLADLYDPLTMPPALVKAHTALDKAVDKCYRSQSFDSESKRIEFLFKLYEEYTAPLMKDAKVGKKASKRQ
jgi:hypothetical protein